MVIPNSVPYLNAHALDRELREKRSFYRIEMYFAFKDFMF